MMDMLSRRAAVGNDEVAEIAYDWPIQNSVIQVYQGMSIYVHFTLHYTRMIALIFQICERALCFGTHMPKSTWFNYLSHGKKNTSPFKKRRDLKIRPGEFDDRSFLGGSPHYEGKSGQVMYTHRHTHTTQMDFSSLW